MERQLFRSNRGELASRALLPAAACGVLLGIAARLVMRFVARESGLDGAFSVEGSLEVVIFGALIGAPVAWLFFALRPRVSLRFPWAGVLCGLCLFLLFSLLHRLQSGPPWQTLPIPQRPLRSPLRYSSSRGGGSSSTWADARSGYVRRKVRRKSST
jgi:hypothetical protein